MSKIAGARPDTPAVQLVKKRGPPPGGLSALRIIALRIIPSSHRGMGIGDRGRALCGRTAPIYIGSGVSAINIWFIWLSLSAKRRLSHCVAREVRFFCSQVLPRRPGSPSFPAASVIENYSARPAVACRALCTAEDVLTASVTRLLARRLLSRWHGR